MFASRKLTIQYSDGLFETIQFSCTRLLRENFAHLLKREISNIGRMLLIFDEVSNTLCDWEEHTNSPKHDPKRYSILSAVTFLVGRSLRFSMLKTRVGITIDLRFVLEFPM